MAREIINEREAIYILMTFIIGSTLIVGIGGESKNDAWLAALTGMIMAGPVILIYARLLALYPGRDLSEILTLTLGKWLGKAIVILYIWYSFHLGSLVIRNFGEFVNIVNMPETPILIPMLMLGILLIVAAKCGVEVMGRTATFFLPLVLLVIVIVSLLAIPDLDVEHLKPVLEHGMRPIFKDGFAAFAFPFAETVLLLGVFSSLQPQTSPYKVYFWSLLLAGLLIVILTMRNIAILGPMEGSLYFPAYVVVGMIEVGKFLQRIEVTVIFVLMFGVFIKGSVCLLVACKGIASLFSLKDYRIVVIQVGLLMVLMAFFIYNTTMLMVYWAFKVYPYYAFPFQVIIPMIVWAVAEIRNRRQKHRGRVMPVATSK